MNIFIKESQHDSQWLERALNRTDIKKIDDLAASFEKSVKAKARNILSSKGISKMDISCVTKAEKGDDMKMICQIKWR